MDVLVADLLDLLPHVVDARALQAERTQTHELIHELSANLSKAVARAGILEEKVLCVCVCVGMCVCGVCVCVCVCIVF